MLLLSWWRPHAYPVAGIVWAAAVWPRVAMLCGLHGVASSSSLVVSCTLQLVALAIAQRLHVGVGEVQAILHASVLFAGHTSVRELDALLTEGCRLLALTASLAALRAMAQCLLRWVLRLLTSGARVPALMASARV